MNSKLKRGLGIGCVVLFIGFMILLGGTVYFSKNMGKEYAVVKDLEEKLATDFGTSDTLPEGFNGLPDVQVMERFLGVRDATAEWRLKVETSFAELLGSEGQEEAKGFAHFVRVLKASRDLAPVFSGFWTSRNQALLDQEMGMGQYIYLYCLTYYSMLEIDPSDGARDAQSFLSGMGATGTTENLDDTTTAEEDRRRWARAQVNTLMLPLMQQAAREASTGLSDAERIWADALQMEVARMQDDDSHVPFAGTLPRQVRAHLESYRFHLEQTYSMTVNPVELIFEDTWEGKE